LHDKNPFQAHHTTYRYQHMPKKEYREGCRGLTPPGMNSVIPWSVPRPAPGRGESPLIPWMGPRFSTPVLTGTRLVNGRGRVHGQVTLKKTPLALLFSGARRGIGPGARIFGTPVTNTHRCYQCLLPAVAGMDFTPQAPLLRWFMGMRFFKGM